ncbi:MAG: hypothetical protein ACI8P3_003138 [Saprospiraceae bacterium]|jgi:hypothetical protein
MCANKSKSDVPSLRFFFSLRLIIQTAKKMRSAEHSRIEFLSKYNASFIANSFMRKSLL